MSVSNGPNLKKMINAGTGDAFAQDFRLFLQMVDALVQCAVISKSLSAPPGSPANGDRYIVGASPTGLWAGLATRIVVWTTDDPAFPSGAWANYTPNTGFIAFNVADSNLYVFSAGAWNLLSFDAGAIVTGKVALARGGTNADLSASGGATAVLAQDAAHNVTARALIAADVPAIAESGVTNLVTDLASCEKAANKGAASGYASLDATTHIPLAQIPAALVGALQFQGTWNAATNSPALASGVGTKGFFYKISVAGNTTIDTSANWHVGDLIIFDGTVWDKIDNYEAVTSVAGRTGAIVLASADLPLPGAAAPGAVMSKAAVSHQFLTSIGTDGSVGQSQPGHADISDYAVGTWTPVWNSATIVGTTTGTYTRIGNLVFFTVTLSTTGTCSGTANTSFITGLPYTAARINVARCIDNVVSVYSNAMVYLSSIYVPTFSCPNGRSFTVSGVLELT